MTLYNEWFNNQSENCNTDYFDKFLNLTELQRTAANCLKAKAIDINIYKTIVNIITKQFENITTEGKELEFIKDE